MNGLFSKLTLYVMILQQPTEFQAFLIFLQLEHNVIYQPDDIFLDRLCIRL
jgi:hypothetical protein